jgi:hypothetical protein
MYHCRVVGYEICQERDYAIYCKGMQDTFEVERISTDICSESIIKYGVGCMDETPTAPSGTATWVIHAGRWC